VPNIKNTCYNGTQMIKTKLISEKIMTYSGASAPAKLCLASPLLSVLKELHGLELKISCLVATKMPSVIFALNLQWPPTI
jgi:hypothetical protein